MFNIQEFRSYIENFFKKVHQQQTMSIEIALWISLDFHCKFL